MVGKLFFETCEMNNQSYDQNHETPSVSISPTLLFPSDSQPFWITLSLALRLRRFNLSSSSDGVIGLFVRIVPFHPCTICLIHASFSSLSFLMFLKSFPHPSCSPPSPLSSSPLLLMMSRKVCFTILSSKLWKEMTASLPPGVRHSKQA